MSRLALVIALLLVACPSQTGGGLRPQLVEPGLLKGHVSIGPLTPVERVGVPTPTVSPDAYAARRIIISKPDGKTVITRIKPDDKGDYSVTLAPGEYVVSMERTGIERARGLPATITITSGETLTLNIDVDTGIR